MSIFLQHLLILGVNFMCDILYPVKLWNHLLFFHLVLLIFLGFVDFVLLKLLLDFIDLFVEKSPDIALLFNQDLWGFILDGGNVRNDLWMKFLNVLHTITVIGVKNTFGPELTNKITWFNPAIIRWFFCTEFLFRQTFAW